MNTKQAKKIVQAFLEGASLPYTKLTARTVSFSDLTRSSCVFVKVWGWQPNPAWNSLKNIAQENGFCVEAA